MVEDRNRSGKREIIPSVPAPKKLLDFSHAFPHTPCRICLFILRTCESQALAWQEGEEFFILF